MWATRRALGDDAVDVLSVQRGCYGGCYGCHGGCYICHGGGFGGHGGCQESAAVDLRVEEAEAPT
eukprot:4802374-Pyramimonas_sp.AAC.2